MILLFLLFVLVALGILAWIYVTDEWRFRKSAPHVNSYSSHRRLLCDKLMIDTGKTILDLGCGDGKMLRFFICYKGCSHGIGYDIRRMSIAIGNLTNRFLGFYKKIVLHNQDYHKADIAAFDIIYLFLWPDVMPELQDWLHGNIKKGAIVITNTFHFPDWQAFETIKNEKGKEVFRMYRK